MSEPLQRATGGRVLARGCRLMPRCLAPTVYCLKANMSPLHTQDKKKTCPPLHTLVGRIDEISSLPSIALQVMEVANDPASGAADLKAVMEGDSSLSARVLRCVNSSAYAIRSEITNLQQAIAYLGTKQIRNLALMVTVSDLFKDDGTIGPYRRSELWRHLVAVGICARMIAMRLKYADFEEMFLGGLLHDIGIVLADQHVHEPFEQLVLSLDGREPLCVAERREFGFDHTMLGTEVANMWGFPEAARAAIRYHHSSAAYCGEHVNVVRCVDVANLLCTLKGIPSVGLKLVEFSAPAVAGLNLAKEDIAILAEDLDRELAANASLFSV